MWSVPEKNEWKGGNEGEKDGMDDMGYDVKLRRAYNMETEERCRG